jgi:hypothetical protein
MSGNQPISTDDLVSAVEIHRSDARELGVLSHIVFRHFADLITSALAETEAALPTSPPANSPKRLGRGGGSLAANLIIGSSHDELSAPRKALQKPDESDRLKLSALKTSRSKVKHRKQ